MRLQKEARTVAYADVPHVNVAGREPVWFRLRRLRMIALVWEIERGRGHVRRKRTQLLALQRARRAPGNPGSAEGSIATSRSHRAPAATVPTTQSHESEYPGGPEDSAPGLGNR